MKVVKGIVTHFAVTPEGQPDDWDDHALVACGAHKRTSRPERLSRTADLEDTGGLGVDCASCRSSTLYHVWAWIRGEASSRVSTRYITWARVFTRNKT